MKEYKFSAKIEPTNDGHGFVFFPFGTQEEFGTRGQLRVQATFDGVPYAGALVKYGAPQHMLPVVKTILEQIGKGPGDTVEVVIKRDDSVRTVEVPPELANLMKKEGAVAAFEKLSYTHRKEYCRWITEAKKEETRQARVAKAVAMLKKGIRTPG
ncbi:MAG: YdeI/OmpD-associated family protein [Terracidiphilus sp.]